MSEKIYTIEQEGLLLETILKDLGIFLNHNYIRAEKGVRPFLHKLLSYSMIYLGHITKSYYLAFTEGKMILLYSDYPRGPTNEHIVRISHENIKNSQ